MVSPLFNANNSRRPGQHVQCGLFAPLPGGSSDQAAASGLHHSHSSVDVCTIIQGVALRLSADCHAVLHLRDYRNAGKSNTSETIPLT